MNVLEALRGEHAVLRAMLGEIGRLIHQYGPPELRAAVQLLESVLLSHASLEDELLFDSLSTGHRGIATALESMKEEHRTIRGLIRGIMDCPPEAAPGRFQHFADLVSEHFAVEERVLFPLASNLVGEEELARLGREWSRRRGVEVPPIPPAA